MAQTLAVALIRSLAWEPPYAAVVALKRPKKKKKKELQKTLEDCVLQPWCTHLSQPGYFSGFLGLFHVQDHVKHVLKPQLIPGSQAFEMKGREESGFWGISQVSVGRIEGW